MTDILSRIIESTRREVNATKAMYSEETFKRIAFESSYDTVSLKESVLSGSGIIAEFKRRSPSRGEIAPMADIVSVVTAYEQAGASAISVLTDTPFFGGSLNDLRVARSAVEIPILRKDFIIDPVQLYVARICGADAVLLIAAALTKERIVELTEFAHYLGLEVLLELHSEEDLEKWTPLADLTGVNSRNLHTFATSLSVAAGMADALPQGTVKIAESGIKTPADAISLTQAGYSGFLIGETFMSTPAPGSTLKEFICALK